MPLVDDTRGVTVQVGAVLLLGLVVLSLSLYQVQVVPAQNAQVEFDHSRHVQSDLQELRNAIQRTAATGNGQPTTVALGTRYPARVVAVNPPPASGSLRTEAAGSVAVTNATALDPDVDDFWNGTTRAYPTKRLVYAPDYAAYDNPPTTVVEGGVVYNRFGGGQTVTLTDAGLVEGRTVSLTTVEGRLSTSRADAVSVDPVPVSATRRTVTVVGDGGPVTLSLQTGLSQEWWRELLADEYVRNGGHIAGNESGVVVEGSTLTVTLEQGVAYDLRLGGVGVGTDVGTTTPAYLTTVEAPSLAETGRTRAVTVEVRDRYDNPLSGVTVATDADRGSVTAVGGGPAVTGADGRVTVEYTAPPTPGGDTVRASYRGVGTGFDPTDPADVAVDLAVEAGGGGSGGGGGGGGGGASLNSPSVEDLAKATGGGSKVRSQAVSFTLGGRLAAGETVTVDLGEAQAGKVDYGGATASVDAGSASVFASGSTATLTYTAPEGGANGRVTLTLDGVELANGAGGPYTVTVTRSDSGDTATTEFGIQ
jgi:hypothetical protein